MSLAACGGRRAAGGGSTGGSLCSDLFPRLLPGLFLQLSSRLCMKLSGFSRAACRQKALPARGVGRGPARTNGTLGGCRGPWQIGTEALPCPRTPASPRVCDQAAQLHKRKSALGWSVQFSATFFGTCGEGLSRISQSCIFLALSFDLLMVFSGSLDVGLRYMGDPLLQRVLSDLGYHVVWQEGDAFKCKWDSGTCGETAIRRHRSSGGDPTPLPPARV